MGVSVVMLAAVALALVWYRAWSEWKVAAAARIDEMVLTTAMVGIERRRRAGVGGGGDWGDKGRGGWWW